MLRHFMPQLPLAALLLVAFSLAAYTLHNEQALEQQRLKFPSAAISHGR